MSVPSTRREGGRGHLFDGGDGKICPDRGEVVGVGLVAFARRPLVVQERMMLLPRYSLRWFFYLFILVALLGVIIGQGVQGSRWAVAVGCGVASLGMTWLAMIAFYAIARLSAAILLPAGAPQRMEAYYPSPAAPRPSADEGSAGRDRDSDQFATEQENVDR